ANSTRGSRFSEIAAARPAAIRANDATARALWPARGLRIVSLRDLDFGARGTTKTTKTTKTTRTAEQRLRPKSADKKARNARMGRGARRKIARRRHYITAATDFNRRICLLGVLGTILLE